MNLIIDLLKKTKKTKFFLNGPVGVGKTHLVKNFFPELHITSPTFNICNQYFSSKYGTIWHFDLYRETIDKDMIINTMNSEDYVFIEWPKKIRGISSIFKNDICYVYLTFKCFSIKIHTTQNKRKPSPHN